MYGYWVVLKDAKIKAAKHWGFDEGCQDRRVWGTKNGCFWVLRGYVKPHGYWLVLKDAKLKAAKHWGFPEGCQVRFLQILQHIGFLLKDAKLCARSVLGWV